MNLCSHLCSVAKVLKPFKVYVIVSGFDFGCQNVISQFAEVPLAVRRAAADGS